MNTFFKRGAHCLLLCLCTCTIYADELISTSGELSKQLEQQSGTNWFIQLFGVGMWPLWILSTKPSSSMIKH